MPRTKSKKDIEPPNKNGRPRIDLDWVQLEILCKLHATEEDCAEVLSVSVDTLAAKIKEKYGQSFSEYFAEKSKIGKLSLRAKQYQVAMLGDTKMLIHLGKHMLGQVDQFIVDQKSSDGSMSPTKITRVIIDNQRPQNKNLKRGPNKPGEQS